jgi:hypothetical protein
MNIVLETLQRELSSAIAGLSAEEMDRHPPGKWCVAEVLEHLYLTYNGTAKGLERVLDAGKSLATRASFKQRIGRLVVTGFSYMPEGRKAPPTATPGRLPREKVLAEIAGKIAEMDAVMSRCESKVGTGMVLDHPILGPLTAAQWRKFHLVHGRHHLKQIRRLRLGL